jgi:hypothetical protein
MHARRTSVCVAAACLILAAGARAQGPGPAAWARGATLGGVVIDQTDAVLPGVDIVAANVGTGTERQTTSGDDGRFLMPLLVPGTYILTAQLAGFAPLEVRDIQVGPDEYAFLRVQLHIGMLRESVTVTASLQPPGLAPRILLPASGNTVEGVRVGGELKRQLPLSRGRNIEDALLLAPGVSGVEDIPQSIHGAYEQMPVVLVDGADLTSNRLGSALYPRLDAAALEDIEVKTAGMDASVPLTQGSVLQVTTRSGTNEIHGSAGLVFNGRSWMGDNEPGGTSPHSALAEPDASLGGPILHDRAWFFASYRQSRSSTASPRTAGEIATLRALVPGWTDSEQTDRAFAGHAKATAQISPLQRVQVFYQRDRSTDASAEGKEAAPLMRTWTGGMAAGAEWSSVWLGSLMTRVSASYNDKTSGSEAIAPNATAVEIHREVFMSQGILVGTGPIAYLGSSRSCCESEPASRLTVVSELTWFHRGGLGSHQLQIGTYLQPRLRAGQLFAYNNGGFHIEEAVLRDAGNPSAGYVPFHRIVVDAAEETVQDIRGHDDALYFQDTWRPAARLTVGLGLRADGIEESSRTTAQTLHDTWAIGPRLSVAFQLTSHDDIRGGWGRVHDSPGAARYVPRSSWTVQVHDLYDLDLDGSFETDFYLPFATAAAPVAIDVNRTQPHVDEVTLGYRRQLPTAFAVDVSFVRREYRAMPTEYNALWFEDYPEASLPPDQWLWHDRVTSNWWNYPVVTDLSAQIMRQADHMQFVASYTRNWRHIAGTWLPYDPASFVQPLAFPNDKGIGSTAVANANSLDVGIGTVPGDRWIDHNFKLAAAVQLPHDLRLAGIYQVHSGPWSGPIVTHLAAPDPNVPPVVFIQGFPIPNPGATTLRFAYATRGEGQLRLPAVHLLNLRVSHRWQTRIGRLEPVLDVFNPFNWNRHLAFATLANQQFSPSFGQGGYRQAPRSMQASLRWTF